MLSRAVLYLYFSPLKFKEILKYEHQHQYYICCDNHNAQNALTYKYVDKAVVHTVEFNKIIVDKISVGELILGIRNIVPEGYAG